MSILGALRFALRQNPVEPDLSEYFCDFYTPHTKSLKGLWWFHEAVLKTWLGRAAQLGTLELLSARRAQNDPQKSWPFVFLRFRAIWRSTRESVTGGP